jgi:hypothetical protein
MGNKLYVGNLPYSARDGDLEHAFSQFGTVTSAKVMMERDSSPPRSKGFGFVEMGSDAEAQAAIKGMNGQDMGGRSVVVVAAVATAAAVAAATVVAAAAVAAAVAATAAVAAVVAAATAAAVVATAVSAAPTAPARVAAVAAVVAAAAVMAVAAATAATDSHPCTDQKKAPSGAFFIAQRSTSRHRPST